MLCFSLILTTVISILRYLSGQNRETFILNPDSTSPEQIQMFEFLGKLMGIAARSTHFMDIMISPMVWKLIVGEDVTLEDYLGVDAIEYKQMTQRRVACSSEDHFERHLRSPEFIFCVNSLGGRPVDLHRNGNVEEVSFDTLVRFCDEHETLRLGEMSTAAGAIRRGLLTQLPPVMISLIKWKDLESMVCGNPNVDIDLLKSCTEYNNYTATDRVILWFWEIMSEFTQSDRKAYLRFTWGRNRLPLTKAGFKQRMKISRLSPRRVEDMDCTLPVSHTCFFSIDIPDYSSKDIMRQKITYAIYNCVAIDGDDTSTGMRAAAMGFEE